jgi:hypothetical protein
MSRLLVAAALLLALPGLAQPPSEPPDMGGMLQAHNAWRKLVNAPPLTWSEEAASMAQLWADQLAHDGCEPHYNPDPGRKARYGENVYRHFSGEPYLGYKRTPQQVVDKWGEEGRFYDLATNTCTPPAGRNCGSYLQLTWDTTEVVGCGHARCVKSEIWVCDYVPQGVKANVRPYGNAQREAKD